MPANYDTLFPKEDKFRPELPLLVALAESMLDDGHSAGEASSVPAGYTYLGQFITHDLSLERLPPGEGPVYDLDTVENVRTPRLDLDSLYGNGPQHSPDLYENDGVRLRVGWSDLAKGEDLPREDPDAKGFRRAVIHDRRNDENLVIAQLHLAFIKFHNRVADVIERENGLQGAELFAAASETVRRHYQWIVRHDFLPRMVDEGIIQAVISSGDRLFKPGFIPVEFAAAAFRFGHSMVRRNYMLEPWFSFPLLTADKRQQDLKSGKERPAGTLITDWSHFFGPDAQLARKIDATLIRELGAVPDGRDEESTSSLPFLDLKTGWRLGLTSGQEAAVALTLPLEERLTEPDFPELTGDLAPFAERTPLWYYCLREAEKLGGGSTLGPLGGRIVAEVLIGLLLADPASCLAVQNWQPEVRFGAQDLGTGVQFGMRELLAFAAGDAS